MANENTPKDLEVRLTELENAVQALTQIMQPAAGAQAQIPQICAPCSMLHVLPLHDLFPLHHLPAHLHYLPAYLQRV